MHPSSLIVSTPDFSIEKPQWSVVKNILPLLSLGATVSSALTTAACDYLRRKAISKYPTLITPAPWYWYLAFPSILLSGVPPVMQLRHENLRLRWNTAYNAVDFAKHMLLAVWPAFFHARMLVLVDGILVLILGCNIAQVLIAELHCMHSKQVLCQIGHTLTSYFGTLMLPAMCISAKGLQNDSTIRGRDESVSISLLVTLSIILLVDAVAAQAIGPALILLGYLLGILGSLGPGVLAKFPVFAALPVPISLFAILVLSFEIARLVASKAKMAKQRSRKNPYWSHSPSSTSPLSATFTYRL